MLVAVMCDSRDTRSESDREKCSCSRDSDQYKWLKRKIRSDKRNHLEAICEEMEEYQKQNDSKCMFTTVNKLIKHCRHAQQ